MNHLDLLKRAFQITWRYRALWLFGFVLALCGGSGGGGGSNFNVPGGSGGDFEELGDLPNMPDLDPDLIIAVIAGVVVLILVLVIVGAVAQVVARTALIGMVKQVQTTQAVTIAAGWRWGWSRRSWRLFLLDLLIGIPVAVVALLLILLALSPLLLLLAEQKALTVVAIVMTILAVLLVLLILFVVSAVIALLKELAWRRTVLDERGVVDSLRDAVGLAKRRFKDVAIVWLLMLGVGIGWAFVALLVVLPLSLLAAVLAGGIPAGLVYLISRSILGAAIAGVPLALLALIVVNSLGTGFYLIYQSAVWTLAYLELGPAGLPAPPAAEASPSVDDPLLSESSSPV
ncbi:MAG: hypothetical protein AB1801_22670 [Chloroflexota bacterium]